MARFDARVSAEVADVKAHYRALTNMAGKGDNPFERPAASVAVDDGHVVADGDLASDGDAHSSADPREGPGRRFAYHKIRVSQNEVVRGGEQSEDDAGEAGEGPGEGEEGLNPSGYDADFFASRDTTHPYPVTPAEFADEHDDWQKLTLTYYEADKVLTDDKEIPIANVVGTVGPDGLKFGLASDDENIVYIRNEHLEVDFEVTRDFRSYNEVVLGYGNPRLTARARQNEL